jgi:hypothetical protein
MRPAERVHMIEEDRQKLVVSARAIYALANCLRDWLFRITGDGTHRFVYQKRTITAKRGEAGELQFFEALAAGDALLVPNAVYEQLEAASCPLVSDDFRKIVTALRLKIDDIWLYLELLKALKWDLDRHEESVPRLFDNVVDFAGKMGFDFKWTTAQELRVRAPY